MLHKISLAFVIMLAALVLSSCGSDNKVESKIVKNVEGRWYSSAQLIRGKRVFKDNCAECHGDKGQGLIKDWREAQPDGKFPAPPLNGSAHTWHHSKELLLRTVNNGGIPLGGTMPAFKDKLADKEKEAVLAHVMSLWPDKIYKTWSERNKP